MNVRGCIESCLSQVIEIFFINVRGIESFLS